MYDVDYVYYSADFGGSLVSGEEFEKLLPKAYRFVDRITSVDFSQSLPAKVKNAVCAVLEASHTVSKQYAVNPAGVKSESNDGVSITYAEVDPTKKVNAEVSAMYAAAEFELAGTGLMYRGI